MFGTNTASSLVDQNTLNFLGNKLQMCHEVRMKYYSYLFNIALFLGFALAVSFTIITQYRGYPSPEEIAQKEEEKRRFILHNIQQYQEAKLRAQQNLITGLPHWDNELRDYIHLI